MMIERGDRLIWGGEVVEVVAIVAELGDRFDLMLEGPNGYRRVTLSNEEIDSARHAE